MDFIELEINSNYFVVIDFPKSFMVEQLGGDIIYKEKNESEYKKLPSHERGYIKLISQIEKLDVEKIFNEISPYNATEISGKRFIDSFLNVKKITIDEDFLNIEGFKDYKLLKNPYIFKLIEKSK